ncbi:hypothetical protein AXG93_731s1320 [Marchantia polymorpha subsp. ruderalis]|uniref:Uncharacterized protein n=1 Tax=Marchantia polymorpha subsp. ruderalis TaxID=1480154 RepID=A0A176VNU8_MARPO|nr:hypothetical protein AXG93_731s1320 [Marchantia polymorpha subsp. ruderalis]
MPSASEIVAQRAGLWAMRLVPTRMRTTKNLWPSEWRSLDVSMDGPLAEELKEPVVKPISGEELLERVVAKVEKTIAEQPTMPLCHVSSGIVKFDCGEGPSAEEPNT